MLLKRCTHTPAQRNACEHPWWVQVKSKRYGRVRVSLERYFPDRVIRGPGSKALARDLERQFLIDVKSGAYAAWKHKDEPRPPKDMLWTDYVDFYIREHIQANGRRYDATARYRLKRIRALWASRRLDEITHADVVLYVNDIKRSGGGGNYQRRLFGMVRHMLRFAADMDLLASSPIKPGRIRLDPPNERTRRLPAEEEDRLVAVLEAFAADPLCELWRQHSRKYQTHGCGGSSAARRALHGFVLTTLDTGLRKNSVFQLRFSMVRWEMGGYGALELPGTLMKGGRPSRKALTPRVRAVFEARREYLKDVGGFHDAAAIFGRDNGEPYKSPSSFDMAWQDAKAAAGIPSGRGHEALHYHDLRGEFGSRLADRGKDLGLIQRALDHRDLNQTRRYIRARVGELDEIVDALVVYDRGPRPGGATEGTTGPSPPSAGAQTIELAAA